MRCAVVACLSCAGAASLCLSQPGSAVPGVAVRCLPHACVSWSPVLSCNIYLSLSFPRYSSQWLCLTPRRSRWTTCCWSWRAAARRRRRDGFWAGLGGRGRESVFVFPAKGSLQLSSLVSVSACWAAARPVSSGWSLRGSALPSFSGSQRRPLLATFGDRVLQVVWLLVLWAAWSCGCRGW